MTASVSGTSDRCLSKTIRTNHQKLTYWLKESPFSRSCLIVGRVQCGWGGLSLTVSACPCFVWGQGPWAFIPCFPCKKIDLYYIVFFNLSPSQKSEPYLLCFSGKLFKLSCPPTTPHTPQSGRSECPGRKPGRGGRGRSLG